MMMVTVAICLVLLIQPHRRLWQRYTLIGIAALAGACILYTYSRSSLVGLVVMLLALAVLEIGLRNLGRAVGYILHRPGTILALVVAAVLMVVGAERVGLMARITRAINLNDPSAVGHLASYEESIPFILEHPVGIGMGMAGRALKFANEVSIEHVESSYLQMMMEIGILATLFVLAVLLLMVWTLRRQRGRFGDPFFEAINIAAQASWLGALTAFAFLPLMQDLQHRVTCGWWRRYRWWPCARRRRDRGQNDAASPAVVTVIVNWNGCATTLACVDALRHAGQDPSTVVVVDNGSRDQSVVTLRTEFPSLTVIEARANLGFARGNNLGIRLVLGRWSPDAIFLLNNDAFITADTLPRLLAALERWPQAGAAVPKIYYGDALRLWYAGGHIDWKTGTGVHHAG
ncbi:MAG: glycosyltransferase [Anaerolineae bacterium]|nr:MAG: glycosyltransferase [Anaerolineae bacterium]